MIISKEKIQQCFRFLSDGIWRVTKGEATPVENAVYDFIKVVLLSVRHFKADRIPERASALTYNTLLSIIPILAILFAIARGLGFDAVMESQFRQTLSPGQAELVISWINSYLTHVRSGVFIGVGLCVLLWSIFMLTDTIEQSFNAIWQVKRPRSMFRKFTDYFSMILLTPILIVVSSGLSIFMTSYIKEVENFVLLAPIVQFLVRLIPYIFTWGMFIALFIFIPNTKVRFKHALLPGIVAGSAFQAFQYVYINSQIWMSNYNAIYGSFAAIPLFLLWAQISWMICLLGAEMSYASQNLAFFSFGKETEHISRRYHDFFCILLLSAICKRFSTEKKPYTAEELGEELRIPIRLTRRILYELQDMGLVYEATDGVDEEHTGYLPGIDTDMLTVGMLLDRIDAFGSEDFKVQPERHTTSWDALRQARQEYLARSGQIRLKDL